ncbi:MAG: carbon storage regulator CsrA [Gemmataceae bacterium]|nr:carbon storage regulator CsrA [Gemmataceae bacterium]
MFVLSRKSNESIVINDDITVSVVELRKDMVRLGIVIPKDATVYRQEVYDAIHKTQDSSKSAWQKTPKRESVSLEALDRLAGKLTEKSKNFVNRAMVIEAILEAAAALEANLSSATSLEEFKEILLRRRH